MQAPSSGGTRESDHLTAREAVIWIEALLAIAELPGRPWKQFRDGLRRVELRA